MFLEKQTKSIMQKGKSYIRESRYFIEKLKRINNIPESAIFFMVNVVGLYPNISQQAGLSAHNKSLDSRSMKHNPTKNLTKMAEFVLRNGYLFR